MLSRLALLLLHESFPRFSNKMFGGWGLNEAINGSLYLFIKLETISNPKTKN
jgi:hypothetical protein